MLRTASALRLDSILAFELLLAGMLTDGAKYLHLQLAS
jgi:hypothetical protein